MAPAVLRTVDEVKAWAAGLRREGRRLALVPTMGYLHEGHLSLMREGRQRADVVATSIFVNPTQFGPKEDLSRYPRDFEGDLAKCASAGVDAVFAPTEPGAMYPPGYQTYVEVTDVSQGLCGARRPGHFRGVATVVTVLLSLVRPDIALFGQKDGQQTLVIKRLVRDLGLGVDVRVVPTVREPDGLAMSSRNRYLGPDERAAAPVLSRALQAAADAHRMGERDAGALRRLMREVLAAEPLATPDYVSVADEATLDELDTIDRPALLSLAVRFPSARLIDCIPVG